nr:transcriptional regulator [Rhizobium leguminosarum]
MIESAGVGVWPRNSEYDAKIAMPRRIRYEEAILLPIQRKMARTALNMGVKQLADAAAVSTNTIVGFKRGEELKPRTIAAIRTVLEREGVVFLDGDYSGSVVPAFG